MNDLEALAARFEEDRHHLRTVAHRLLGSVHDADDAVQAAWLKVSRRGRIHVIDIIGDPDRLASVDIVLAN